jgi:hypothetical protein
MNQFTWCFSLNHLLESLLFEDSPGAKAAHILFNENQSNQPNQRRFVREDANDREPTFKILVYPLKVLYAAVPEILP